MPNTIVTVSPDGKFPVGTSVAAYPARGAGNASVHVKRHEGPNGHSAPPSPAQAAAETQTVAAAGTLTYTTLTTGAEYMLYASVGGENRYAVITGA